MANSITKTVLIDGPRSSVVHFYLEGDGSGEFNNELLLDLKNDIVPIGSPSPCKIQQIWWSNSYYDARLAHGGVVPVYFWVLPVGSDSHVDFRSFGGVDLPMDIDDDSTIRITTSGLSAGGWGTIVLHLVKD